MSMIGNFLMINESDYQFIINNPDKIEEFLYDKEHGDDVFLDIDKTWNIIHFLLTGESLEGDPPEADVILGGIPIGEIDVGYGPARILDHTEIENINKLLQNIPFDKLIKNFDLDKIAELEIYPIEWDGSSDDIDYIKWYYEKLLEFYLKAKQKQYYVIQYLN